MRKECVQTVQGLCRKLLRAVPNKSALWTQAYLYPIKTQATNLTVHTTNRGFVSVIQSLMPTIHTPYIEQKILKLNFLLLSTVENSL